MADAELRRLAEAPAKHVDDVDATAWRRTVLDFRHAIDEEVVLALLDRIDAVRALHVRRMSTPDFRRSPPSIPECGLCRGREQWPCRTIRALDGTP